jgi:hypothetical protein
MKRIFQIVLLALLLGGGALAQEPAKDKDAQGWEQVNGDMMQQGESIPASRLVGVAYGFIFVAVVVWVASVAQRARRLEDEVEALKKKVQARG